MRSYHGITLILMTIIATIPFATADKTTAANAKISDQASNVLLKQTEEIASKRVSKQLRDQAKCILVFPQVIKRGLFVIGDQKGEGLASCRLTEKTWSAPLYVELNAATVGLQAGIQDASIIFFLMNQSAVNELLDPKIKLGKNFDFIAGPVGRAANVKEQPPIISYVRTTGLFAGLDIEGVRVSFMEEKNIEAYGKEIASKHVLTESTDIPDRFSVFMSTLTAYAPVPVKK